MEQLFDSHITRTQTDRRFDLQRSRPPALPKVSSIVRQFIRLRHDLSGQLKDLESGKVKVLELIDGGRTDEDLTDEHIVKLQSWVEIIDAVLQEIRQPDVPVLVVRAAHQPENSESLRAHAVERSASRTAQAALARVGTAPPGAPRSGG
jgi:hypothetical protein